MKNNFLILFDSMSPSEVNEFQRFLEGFYRGQKVMMKVFRFYCKINKKGKTYPSLKVACEKIFLNSSPTKKELSKLRNSLSDLNLAIKDFLIYKQTKKAKLEKEFIWLQVLEDRKLEHKRDLQIKNISKKIAEEKLNSIWFPFGRMLLHHFLYFRNTFQKNDPGIVHIREGIKNLDDFYIGMKLKYAAEIKNRQNLFPSPYKPILLKPIIASLKNKTEISLPIKTYFLLYNLLNENDLKSFHSLKDFFLTEGNRLDQEEQITILISSINFIASEIRKGKQELNKEAFALYQYALENDILIYKEFIDASQFLNMINVACHLKEFKWAKNVVNTQKKYLKDNLEPQYSNIAFRMIYFGEENYRAILNMSQSVKFDNIHLELLFKIYFLASKFELEEKDELSDDCDTFIRFIKRHKKLGEDNKNANIRFAQILKALINQRKSKKALENEFKKIKKLHFRSWLSKKIASYIQIKTAH